MHSSEGALAIATSLTLVESYVVDARCDDGSMKQNNGLKVWMDLQARALEKMGRLAPTENQLRERLERNGFEDVVVSSFKQPLGPWAKDERLRQIGALVCGPDWTEAASAK